MRNFKRSCTGAAKALLLLSASVPAITLSQDVMAQQVTSGVRGQVSGPDGNPVGNATIVITDTRTGRSVTTQTSGQGLFTAGGLEVGGPYTVLIDTDRYRDERVEGLFLNLSEQARINVQLQAGAIEEIVITAAPLVLTKLAIGPSASFGLETLESLPSIQRDIRDTIRLDPRVTIDDSNDDSIQCLGGNNRFNSFTIDGVRNADSFGLNASGFPSRNTLPIPFDSIRETAVEFSPFSVEYGQFTGCNVNVVTKSGANDYHGSAFFVFNSDGLTGNTLDGDIVNTESFRDWNWGAELSGPIVKDKLFFYFAYEETDDSDTHTEGPAGAGFANDAPISQADADRLQNIVENQYGRETFGLARQLPEQSRRYLGRLDWFITDEHRAAFTYTRLREQNVEADDFFFNGFSFFDNFEREGSEIETYSLRVFSDWTENFSTEFRISRINNTDLQDPIGGGEAQSDNPLTRLEVDLPSGDSFVSGPGFFRSSNFLDTQIDQIKAKAEYRAGRHTLTAGYELDQLDVFNLFIPNATGTIAFDSIDDFEAGNASFAFFGGSFTGDPNDAAANFSRSIHSIYLQDEIEATSDLLLTFGVRYDFYKSSDNPPLNDQFVARYGFDNTQAFDGLDIILPRFGFSYDAPWDFYGQTTFRGGAGVFTGGDPSVWFSNAFSNFGSSQGTSIIFDDPCNPGQDLQVLDASGNFTGLPQCLVTAASQEALSNNGAVQAVDPNFKLPSIVRGSFGFTHFTDFGGAANGFFDNWEVNFDIIHTRRRNAPDFIDLTLTPVGFAPDGRPIFNRVDPLQAGCNATFLGPRRGFSGNTERGGACSVEDDQDILLTNVADGVDNGGSITLSTQFAKTFDYDAFNRPGSINFNVGYAYTSARDVNPTTSSTATSNTEEVALSVINNPQTAQSQFVNRHNVTVSAVFRNDWIEDYTTTFGLIFRATEGRPFSYTFNARDDNRDDLEDLFGDTDDEDRQLLYIPTGPNDPLVDFSQLSQSDIDQFFATLEEAGLSRFAGQIAPRNAFRDPWYKDLDIRFAQEIPGLGFFDDDRFELTIDIDNFLNLIDSGSNVQRTFGRGDVGEAVPLARAELSEDGNQYRLTRILDRELDRIVDASVWRVQVGVRYKF